jgi:adenosylcobinamide-phosphate synthase
MWRTDTLQLLTAVGVDVAFGDPRNLPHLTRAAGGLIGLFERALSAPTSRSIPGGALLWVCVNATMLSGYFLARMALDSISPALAWIWDALVIYQTLAARDLDRHARDVLRPLLRGDIESGRVAAGRIVGRDTATLDEGEVSRAAVEAVAESATDGFVAPLFWAAIGGAPAALVYRTSNTLDSMVGHRNERYENFGKVSARIDDVLSFIPARLCALASLLPRGFSHAFAVKSEARAHPSPNAGWSEAAAAWALNLRLGGTNHYDGLPHHGPVFNPSGRTPQPNDILRVLRWFWGVALVCVILLASALAVRERQKAAQTFQFKSITAFYPDSVRDGNSTTSNLLGAEIKPAAPRLKL